MDPEKDVKAEESSTSGDSSEPDAIETFETVDMADMTEAERSTWLAKGTVPDRYKPKAQAKPKDKEESTAAKAAKDKETADAKAKADTSADPDKGKETEAASETAGKDKQKPSEEKPKGEAAERRIAQLSKQIQDGLKEKKTVTADVEKAKAELAEVQKKLAEAGLPKTEKVEKASDLKRPRMKDFGTDDEYEVALDAYERQRDLLAAERSLKAVNEALEKDRTERTQAQERQRVEEANRKIEDTWKKQVRASTERHDDFADVALADDIPGLIEGDIDAVMDSFILKKEWGSEVLYYLGEHKDEAQEIHDMEPYDKVIALGKIHGDIVAKLKGTAGKDKGKEAAEEAPPITRAPKPPTDLSSKKAAPVNEVEAAIDNDDFADYRAKANAEEAAKKKAGLGRL